MDCVKGAKVVVLSVCYWFRLSHHNHVQHSRNNVLVQRKQHIKSVKFATWEFKRFWSFSFFCGHYPKLSCESSFHSISVSDFNTVWSQRLILSAVVSTESIFSLKASLRKWFHCPLIHYMVQRCQLSCKWLKTQLLGNGKLGAKLNSSKMEKGGAAKKLLKLSDRFDTLCNAGQNY